MKSSRICAFLLCALAWTLSMPVSAQAWDAAGRASSWAKQDKDDSFTFYDAQGRFLHTWVRDGGLMRSISLAKLEVEPDRWVVDPRNNAWVAHGTTLTLVDRSGRLTTSVKLPAEVGDVCWDAKGFVISYRTVEPYLEKRDFKGTEVLWSFGAKPPKREGSAPVNRRPIVSDDSGNVLLADGNNLNLSILDGATGRKLSETNLTLGGTPAPALEGNAAERGPLALWPGKSVAFAAVPAAQVPASQRGTLQGLALARLDLAQSRLEFLPTGLDESYLLVGVLDADAVFAGPKGGLMLVKIK